MLDERFKVDESYIKTETERLRKGLHERYKKFMGDHSFVELRGKNVIIVDDGVATGSTILAAIEMIRHKNPAKVVVAVPVASKDAASKIQAVADEFVCLSMPSDFTAVGQFYYDFKQVEDEEVIEFLREIENFCKPHKID